MLGFGNFFGAFGHSHYGPGMAPGTGRLLAQIVTVAQSNTVTDGVGVACFCDPGNPRELGGWRIAALASDTLCSHIFPV